MLPPIAEVFAPDRAVHDPRKQMVDASISQQELSRGVALPKDLLGERHALLAAFGSREAKVLAGGEIAGMGNYEVQEAGLVLGVAKPAKVLNAGFAKLHGYRLRIAVMISRSSRTRRWPATSSDRA